ncbi:rhodopsin, freshwater form-like [Maniola hyperantus]|uniref:rhodopsin, freshwater form-like n=1 Tax=Aphantopus hyperantus TaxID=2795564 RepID=UPI001568DF0A|nr:rhodopsin, freshwater form-like [Maniola hyperantus]
MEDQSCTWSDVFDEQSKANLERGFIITGTVSTLLGSWLTLALLLTNLRADLGYRNFAFFTVIACVRRAVSVLTHLPFLNYTEISVDEIGKNCNFYGFWDTFVGVLEVECLTHVCIERYVVAKYNTKGWPIQKNHYILYPCLCILFALLYSSPPLFGLGKYGLDFSCQSCTLDMILPSTWHRYVVLSIFLLRSIKSTGFMVFMLIWARNLEAKYNDSVELVKEIRFTESVIIITIVNLMCWMPIALVRGWVVLSYLLSDEVQVKPSASAIQFAIWIHWVSPAVTAIAMFLADGRMHKKMLSVCKSDDIIEEPKKKE